MSNLNLNKIPKNHGIYQFFDKKNIIIYIGKSVNLKARVNSYFNGQKKLNFAKQKMVKQIEKIKTIVTNNETESLILETTLIKKHQPKYNILMKDGKNHTYIKITNNYFAKLIKTRIKNKNGIYFGPYTSTNYVNNILKFLKKNFGYRSCNVVFEKKGENGNFSIKSTGGRKIPCLDYYIKTCSGPCLLEKEKEEEYKKNIEKIKLFLKGNNSQIIKNLEEKMLQKAKQLKFEEANNIKKQIDSIKGLNINQIARDGIKGDYKIINFIEKFDKFYIGLIEIKESKITGFYNYEIKNELNEEKEEILKNFIERNFIEEKNCEKKNFFIIPFKIKEKLNQNIILEIPQIGTKKELLDLCYKNIYEYAYKNHLNSLSTKGFSKKTMQNLLDILNYKKINNSIIFECNDISHISGNYTVASRSIIENGKSNTKKYKKFKIKTLSEGKIDDFGALKEIIKRRLKEIEKNKFIPDLIIIDGGKGQLNSVIKIIKSSSLAYLIEEKKLQIISIAKKEEELFLPGEKESIILDKNSFELRLIQKIRDEAHRFAISFNRDTRIKNMKKNILESIPGIGPKTRIKLLKKFGNIENISKAGKEELLKLINKNQYSSLEEHGII